MIKITERKRKISLTIYIFREIVDQGIRRNLL